MFLNEFRSCLEHLILTPSLDRKTISFRKTRSIDFDKLRNELNNSSLILDPSPDLDALVDHFNTTLSKLVDVYAPVTTKTVTIRPYSPWYTDEIALEKRKRRSLERRWRSTRLPGDYENYVIQCDAVNSLLKSAKVSYYGNIIKNSKHDQRVLFQTVDRLLHTKSDPLYPTSSSDSDLANKIADFFTEKITSLRNSLDGSSSTLVHLDDFSHASRVLSHFKNVTEAQVSSLITGSAVKSCPLDPAPAVVLKNAGRCFCL